MTHAALEKRVRQWQQSMPCLGLAHWRIEIKILEELRDDRETNASVVCSSHYDTAWMEFERSFLNEAEEAQVDQTIVHELVHMAMRDFDNAISDVYVSLGQPARAIWMDHVDHAREGLVERLARTLYYTSRPDVVRSS